MKYLLSLLILFQLAGCVHYTAMSDEKLKPLWNGNPMSDKEIADAKLRWPRDVTLLDMQEAMSLLRKGSFTDDDLKRAKFYLEQAALTFEDLRQPDNFSVAFSADSNTPYRGRPHERVLITMLMGLLDMDDKRCDLALPAFKAAEFLDARWQVFNEAPSDAPMVYALMLRCLYKTKASETDIQRAQEGLFRSIRLSVALDSGLNIMGSTVNKDKGTLAEHIALVVMDVGIPSALINANRGATWQDILMLAKNESIKFVVRALSKKDEPFSEALAPMLKDLNKEIKSKESGASAGALAKIETAIIDMIGRLNEGSSRIKLFGEALNLSQEITDEVERALKQQKLIVTFGGKGPTIESKGTYKEIARVVPNDRDDAKDQVKRANIGVETQCGAHLAHGVATFVLCDDDPKSNRSGNSFEYLNAIQLWSTSFQATSMAGRRFEEVLKGRAVFKSSANTVALVSAVAAVALLDVALRMSENCRRYGTGCQAATGTQIAAGVAGAIALGSFIAGAIVNPEADTRHVTKSFETGYIVLHKN